MNSTLEVEAVQEVETLLFYDIEVFSQNALIVFKDINKKLIRVFHNNFTKLGEFIAGKTLVGFNNYYYDDRILTYMLELKSVQQIKQLNDKIIAGENVSYIKPRFDSLDVFQQIDVSNPSLKRIEGNYGRKILESSVPFSIERELTPDEFIEVLDYCSYDVDTTIDIYKERIESYFKPKKSLVEMLGKKEAIKWNTTTISANLLLDKPLVKWSNIRVDEELLELVPAEVKDMWLEKAASFTGDVPKKKVTIEMFDNIIEFAFGGLHGAHKTIKKAKRVKLLDVASMYPNLILILNCLANASEKYRMILLKRLAVKKSDPVLSEALKLILNSVYGNLGNKYSLLYNPKALLSVVILGQIALFELCKRIAPFATIININTDGVAFIPHDENDDAYEIAYKQWEQDFNLQLEEKEFETFIQSNVNNYIAVKADGSVKCKGGDVNRYEKDALFKNNNARVVDIALVNKLIYGKDILETLVENLNKPHLFQYILKAGNTYNQEYNKVNRVFATEKEGFCLFKKRHDEGLVRFPDAPMNMYLWNDDCSEIEDFAAIVDINHYYQLVIKKLERWT